MTKETPEIHIELDKSKLPIEYYDSKTLIGTDKLRRIRMEPIKQQLEAGIRLDPVIVYRYKGALFILEGNQRAGSYGELKQHVPCVVVENDDDFQKVKKMGIKLGNLNIYSSLEEAQAALAEHLLTIRKDIYSKYFAE